MTEPVRVAAFYRFASFADPASIRAGLAEACERAATRGTILVAPEGINGTIAGSPEGVTTVLDAIRALPGCADLEVKFADADSIPFHRMKVRLKREIVTMGQPAINPASNAGRYVPPAEWDALIAAPDVVVIDTRNDYEVAVGTFDGAIDPGTKSFGEFPAWFRANRDALLAGKTRVAMFCTGGIRCEKSTAFLRSEGIEEVYHLEGGILKYLETVPAEASTWRGECFVFDERVAVGHGLAPGTHELCRACRMPVSPADRSAPTYVEGISCPACHASRDDSQRAGYAERHRQARLAAERGVQHIGAVPPRRDA